MKLRSVDLGYSSLKNERTLERFNAAIKYNNMSELAEIIQEAYGNIAEVLFVSGPFSGRSIIVFENGTGIIVGADTPIGVLTHGYTGQGPTNYKQFLGHFSFLKPDLSSTNVPSILSREGLTVLGQKVSGNIIWEDGQELPIDSIFEQYEKIFHK